MFMKVPHGESNITIQNARQVVKMAGCNSFYTPDDRVFYLKESTVMGVKEKLYGERKMNFLHFRNVSVLIPTDDIISAIEMTPALDFSPHRFVSVFFEVKVPQSANVSLRKHMHKTLQYGDVEKGIPSTVYMEMKEEYEATANVVISLHSNHNCAKEFTVIIKTPGHADTTVETVLGKPGNVEFENDMGETVTTWDWRFLCMDCAFHDATRPFVVTRDTIWEVWTVIRGNNAHLFNIAFAPLETKRLGKRRIEQHS